MTVAVRCSGTPPRESDSPLVGRSASLGICKEISICDSQTRALATLDRNDGTNWTRSDLDCDYMMCQSKSEPDCLAPRRVGDVGAQPVITIDRPLVHPREFTAP